MTMKRYNFSEIQGNPTSDILASGTLVIDDSNNVRLHDGTVAGGRVVGAKVRVTGNGGSLPPLTTSITPVELGSGGMDLVQGPGSWDDNAFPVSLPFPVKFAGVMHSTIWISSNSYVVFSDTDTNTWYIPNGGNDFDAILNNFPLPVLMISGRDNSYQQVFTATENGGNTFRIRWEGTSSTVGTPGSPNMVWEMVFYANDATRIDLHIITNNQNNGTTMVSQGTVNLGSFDPTAGNSYTIRAIYMPTLEASVIKFTGATDPDLSIVDAGNGVVEVTLAGGGNANTGNVLFEGNIVYVNGGEGATGFLNLQNGDGEVTIGSNNNSPLKISVNENINAKEWLFDTNGNLTLPGDISTRVIGFSFNSSITNISLDGPDVYVNLADGVFGGPITGEVTISGVTGMTEANGTWYYEATDPGQFRLKTDGTFSTNVDGSAWGSYSSGGTAVSGGYKDLNINVGDSQWTFNGQGALILPVGGDIKNSDGNSVLGGGSANSFTTARVAGQDDILAAEAGNTLELVAGDNITITTNASDGTITIAAAGAPVAEQYGYFNELTISGNYGSVNGEAVALDPDSNSYVSYSYYDYDASRSYGGVMKFSSTGEKLWTTTIEPQTGNLNRVNIVSLEYSVINGSPLIIALGYYYDNNSNRDTGFMYYVNPTDGTVGSEMIDVELASTNGMKINDGVAGVDGNGAPFAVLVGSSYSEMLTKNLTPLAGSTVDKVYFSWADINASGIHPGEQLIYRPNGGYCGFTVNSLNGYANPVGSSNPFWSGLAVIVAATEAGGYQIIGTNGWGWAVNTWDVPTNLTVLGSSLGGVDGVNDLTFDFDRTVFNDNSNNLQAAISNIQGTAQSNGVYCPGWNGYDWSVEVGNTLNLEYSLNDQAFIARFGDTQWTKEIGATQYDRLTSVVVADDGNIYASGYYSNNNKGSLVIKFDINGLQQWAVYTDPTDTSNNDVWSIDLLSDGNVITVDDAGVVTKLDSGNGTIIWQVRVSTNPSWDGDFRGTATPDGDYIFANYESNDYTMYVMRISGADGSSVWTKQISRYFAGNYGEIYPQNDFEAQYIDCNATYVTIAGSSEPPNGNRVGLVYSFPIDGQNVDGTYGQYNIASQSMDINQESTTATAATITETNAIAEWGPQSPGSSSPTITATTINIGGGSTPAPSTVITWTNPNDNVWRIEDYNGGAAVSYYGGDGELWWDAANAPSGNDQFRGAIIQYHAKVNGGNIIGTIHLANDYSQQGATHTEHLSGGADINAVSLWECRDNRGQLYFKRTDGSSDTVMIQWTAKVFYGSEYNC